MWPFQRSKGRRRPIRRGPAWYLQPKWQVTTILVGAIVAASLLFTGALFLNYTQTNDHILQAQQLMNEGKLAWAAQELESVVEQDPKAYMAWVYLGQCYLELNDVDKAENAFESAMAIRRNADTSTQSSEELDLVSTLAKAKILGLQNRYKEAEGLLTKLYETHPGNTDLKAALWDVYYRWGTWHLKNENNPEKALELFQQARSFVTRYRYDMTLQNAMTDAIEKSYDRLLKTPETTLATRKKFLESALDMHYSHPLLDRLARVQSEMGEKEKALDTLRQAYALSPTLYGLRYVKSLEIAKGDAQKSGDKKASARYNQSLAEVGKTLQKNDQKSAVLPYVIAVSLNTFEADILDAKTGEWQPKLGFTITNQDPDQTVERLRLRVRLSSGGATLFQQYVSLNQALTPKGDMASSQPMTIPVETSFTPQQLKGGILECEIAVTFEEGSRAVWFPMLSQKKEVIDPAVLQGVNFPWETAKKDDSKKPASTLPREST